MAEAQQLSSVVERLDDIAEDIRLCLVEKTNRTDEKQEDVELTCRQSKGPPQADPAHFSAEASAPSTVLGESVLRAEPRTASKGPRSDLLYLDWFFTSETADQSPRPDFISRIKSFVESSQKVRSCPVTVVFTADADIWDTAETLLAEVDAALFSILQRHNEKGSDMVPEMTDFLVRFADRWRVGAFSLSCIRVEHAQGLDMHLILSQE